MKAPLESLFLLASALVSTYAVVLPSKWDGPFQLPSVAVMAFNMPDGRVLTWSAYSRNNYDGGGRTYTSKFDPTSDNATEALIQNTNHDMFCSGTAQLGDGRIMITGGADSSATTIYDPASDIWSIGPSMVISRGYHAMTVLTDGSVFTIGGSWSGGYGNKYGEVWNVTSGLWAVKPNLLPDTLLTNDLGGIFRQDNHMWLDVAPNGKVFHSGPARQMHWIDVQGNGAITPSVLRGDDTDAMNGNAVMFDVGKILKVGGGTSYEGSPGSKSAYVIDINGAEAVVERVGDMAFNRTFSNSVVLPSGEVVVIGGMVWAVVFSDLNPVLQAEIWNPATKTFSLLGSMTVPRNYHSVGVLLKDGRVMSSGGGLCGNTCNANHLDAEILTPPYLLNADGSPATRPVVLSAPDTIIPGGTISVSVDTATSHSFAIIRLSVTTHAVNNDQRRIPLPVFQATNNTFTVLVPSNPNVVLPGSYFLFAINANGVPSVAHVVSRPLQYTIPPNPTLLPTPLPTAQPTISPTKGPTPIPTAAPSKKPSASPTIVPTGKPTTNPTAFPSKPLTLPPTPQPTVKPTTSPTKGPTHTPTGPPSKQPSAAPTVVPTALPTTNPAAFPSNPPTLLATPLPTGKPTTSPTKGPTHTPTGIPSKKPSAAPTIVPTASPTTKPTAFPSNPPTLPPSPLPTNKPTTSPTKNPTQTPTTPPSKKTSSPPSSVPTSMPTTKPTSLPTNLPSQAPVVSPSRLPTPFPTFSPTEKPTNEHTLTPTKSPTRLPSNQPTAKPTKTPTSRPTTSPSKKPTPVPTKTTPASTNQPTSLPTPLPTNVPTSSPTNTPTKAPTRAPTARSSKKPTVLPTKRSTFRPTRPQSKKPTPVPTKTTLAPTKQPTTLPTSAPTYVPTSSPTNIPTKALTLPPTARPLSQPTAKPTKTPTSRPTTPLSKKPTPVPTKTTNAPTNKPTTLPTLSPTSKPTARPVAPPTSLPTKSPSIQPTIFGTSKPTLSSYLKPTPPPTSSEALTVGAVTNFTLVNAFTGQPLQTLTNGTVVRLSTLGFFNLLNFRANTVGSVQRVQFAFMESKSTVSTQPFVMQSLWFPDVGFYSLRATPFLSSIDIESAGKPLEITFKTTF